MVVKAFSEIARTCAFQGKLIARLLAICSLAIVQACNTAPPVDRLDRCAKTIEKANLNQGLIETDIVLFTLRRGILRYSPCPGVLIGINMGEEVVLEMQQSLEGTSMSRLDFPWFKARLSVSSVQRYDRNLHLNLRTLKSYKALPDRNGQDYIRSMGISI